MRSINSLVDAIVAALALPSADQVATTNSPVLIPDADLKATVTLPSSLNDGVRNIYAGHRSHSSHSSHSSHYSGSGGSSSTPSSDSSSYQTAPAPLASPQQPTKPTSDQLRYMIMRVQAGLYSHKYDPGAIDGVLSEATKAAIRKYQSDRHITVTGTMTTELLDSLGIRAD